MFAFRMVGSERLGQKITDCSGSSLVCWYEIKHFIIIIIINIYTHHLRKLLLCSRDAAWLH